MKLFQKNHINFISAFSLVELLVVLFIVGLLASIALPAFKNLYLTSQSQSIRDQINDAFLFAAQESETRQLPVILELTSPHELKIYIKNSNKILRKIELTSQQGYLIARIFPKTQTYFEMNNADDVYNHDGTLLHCNNAASLDWAIIVSVTGQVRIAMPDSSGKIIDSHGRILGC
jgi:prepilin-type N-terminal cleavage/methylation domain-containing protein